MKKKSTWTIFLFAFFFISCNGTSERIAVEYFDLETLVAQQIHALTSMDPILKKKASINGVVEEKKRKLEMAEWASELNIFLEADINKPRLIGSYEKEEVVKGAHQTIEYKAKDPDDVQVQFLRIIFMNDKLTGVESLFKERNILYSTSRNLQMNFTEDNNRKPVLSGYLIYGQQKMILKNAINYNIKSEILF